MGSNPLAPILARRVALNVRSQKGDAECEAVKCESWISYPDLIKIEIGDDHLGLQSSRYASLVEHLWKVHSSPPSQRIPLNLFGGQFPPTHEEVDSSVKLTLCSRETEGVSFKLGKIHFGGCQNEHNPSGHSQARPDYLTSLYH